MIVGRSVIGHPWMTVTKFGSTPAMHQKQYESDHDMGVCVLASSETTSVVFLASNVGFL